MRSAVEFRCDGLAIQASGTGGDDVVFDAIRDDDGEEFSFEELEAGLQAEIEYEANEALREARYGGPR